MDTKNGYDASKRKRKRCKPIIKLFQVHWLHLNNEKEIPGGTRSKNICPYYFPGGTRSKNVRPYYFPLFK